MARQCHWQCEANATGRQQDSLLLLLFPSWFQPKRCLRSLAVSAFTLVISPALRSFTQARPFRTVSPFPSHPDFNSGRTRHPTTTMGTSGSPALRLTQRHALQPLHLLINARLWTLHHSLAVVLSRSVSGLPLTPITLLASRSALAMSFAFRT